MNQLVLVIIALYGTLTALGTCVDMPIPSSLSSCSDSPSQRTITAASLPNLGMGSKRITINFWGQVINNLCLSLSTYHYVSVTIGEPAFKNFDFKLDGGLATYIIGVGSSPSFLQLVDYSNLWVEFGLAVDLNIGKAMGAISTAYKAQKIDQADIPGYDSSWIFDSKMKFYFCSEVGGTIPVICQIKGLKIKYDAQITANTGLELVGYLSPVLLGHYLLKERSGTVLQDSQGQFGSAYFGSSSPDTTIYNYPFWQSGVQGLSFTTSAQYVTLPNQVPILYSDLYLYSMAINFWLKLNNPADGSYVFRIYPITNSLFDNFACKVTTANQVQAVLGNLPVSAGYSAGTAWQSVTLSFSLKRDQINYIAGIRVGSQGNVFSGTLSSTLAFSGIDFRIGGPPSFTGQIASFKVMSPGSHALIDTSGRCFSSTANQVIGISDPPLILKPVCDSSCADDQCFDSTETGCLACASGKSFSTSNNGDIYCSKDPTVVIVISVVVSVVGIILLIVVCKRKSIALWLHRRRRIRLARHIIPVRIEATARSEEGTTSRLEATTSRLDGITSRTEASAFAGRPDEAKIDLSVA